VSKDDKKPTPVKYKCGHVVNEYMGKTYGELHGKRFICRDCRRKELGC
jgi:hypothetical protein